MFITEANGPVSFTFADSLFMGSGGSITSNGFGVLTTWGGTSLFIGGQILVSETGILAGGIQSTVSFTIDVLPTGVVYGLQHGIYLTNATTLLDNAGLIKGAVAVRFAAGGDNAVTDLRNMGTILGQAAGIRIDHDEVRHMTLNLTNFGMLSALAAVQVLDADSPVTLINHGQIFGTVQTGDADDRLVNRGEIEGDFVMTGGGDDLINDARGKSDGIRFDMGAGNDQITLGRAVEEVEGGAGLDSLGYETSLAVTINLADPSQNQGAAAGDSYSGIEMFRGSDRGGDAMTGDGAANGLAGLGGKDTLAGGAGADSLEGGRGTDRMTGGAGRDSFVYRSYLEGGDEITDFQRGSGPAADRIALQVGFVGDLVAGTLAAGQFRARTDNLAQDSDDRLIFRTTDHSLWADPDGSGPGFSAVLICILTNGVNLQATDILVF